MSGPRLTTSPLFFIQPANPRVKALEVRHNDRFRRLAPEIHEVADFFLEPHDRAAAEAAGISPQAVETALETGILLPEDHPELSGARLWEDHRWSRAAHLVFSQQDLPYTEPTEDDPPLAQLVEFRRNAMRGYLARSPYPPRHLAEALEIVELPEVERPPEPDLDALLRRRSVRDFSDEPVSLESFAGLLWEATYLVRLADDSKEGGDPFYLLNSFYTWLELYVVVQGVEGLRRGVYQYDLNRGHLRAVAWDTRDEEILPTIQHQDWIGGGGFCVYYVVHWERYQWIYRHSRAYVNLLIQIGEIGQEVLQAACRRGLGAWPTPAVHESRAAALLELDMAQRDALYFTKVGPPKPGRR
jgi:SagB-type dehydrogenase family enzyme